MILNKFMHFAREEIKTEMMACTHIVIYVICYAFLIYIFNKSSIGFWTIVEMSVLGYVSAWSQTLLFWKDKTYSKASATIRSICWIIVPSVLTCITGICFKWFDGIPAGYEWGFYGFILFYFIMFLVFIKLFFKKETKELNEWLENYKKNKM